MKRNKIIFALSFIVILALGTFLRLKNNSVVPRPGESMDGYSNSWVGLSLIRLGLPVGRSGLVGYGGNDNRYINVDRFFSSTATGAPMGINRPWFDHPPLLPLITGGYAYLTGSRVFEDNTESVIRKPLIGLSILSLISLGIFATALFGGTVGLTTMLLFATSPLLVISSRMGQGEIGLLITFPLALLFLHQYRVKKREHWLWLAALLAGLSIWFKITGVTAMIFGSLILLSDESKKFGVRVWEIILFATVPITFMLTFFVFGAAYDWSVFVSVWQANSSRPYDIGFGSIFNLLTTTKITVSKYLTDGWPFVGWVSLFLLWQKKNREIFLYVILPLVSYLLIFLLMGNSSYGWYRLPLMPFLMLLAALFLTEGLRSGSKFLPVFLLLIPLGINLTKLNEIYHLSSWFSWWRPALPGVLAWFFFTDVLGQPRRLSNINKVLYLLLFFATIATNGILTYSIGPDYWLKIS